MQTTPEPTERDADANTDRDTSRGAPVRGDPHPELPDDPDLGGRPVHLHPSLLALVGVGGAAGTGARYALSAVIPAVGGWPTGIFVINLVGAFLLGWLVETLAARGPDEGRRRSLRLLLGTGFCGGFTTYSALAVDTEQLLRHGPLALGLAYGLGTVAIGFGLSWLGVLVAGRGRRAGP